MIVFLFQHPTDPSVHLHRNRSGHYSSKIWNENINSASSAPQCNQSQFNSSFKKKIKLNHRRWTDLMISSRSNSTSGQPSAPELAKRQLWVFQSSFFFNHRRQNDVEKNLKNYIKWTCVFFKKKHFRAEGGGGGNRGGEQQKKTHFRFPVLFEVVLLLIMYLLFK